MLVRLLRCGLPRRSFHECSSPPSFPRPARCRHSYFQLLAGSMNADQPGGGLSAPLGGARASSVRHFHKLIVENLPKGTTKEMVHQHFSEYGTLISVESEKNAGSTTFNVIFAKKKAFEKVVSSQLHVINNYEVCVRPLEAVRISVKNLSPCTTEESLRAYFSAAGKVVGCDVEDDREAGIYGLVKLYVGSEKAKVLAHPTHLIDGEEVRVRILSPNELKHYVSKLSPNTTAESLTAFYSQFGTSIEAKVGCRSNRHLLFGHVHFTSQEQVGKAVRSLPHIIDGKEVRFEHNTRQFTLFADELPQGATEDSLKQYFEKFGPVFRCQLVRDGKTSNSAWVIFSSKQGLNRALADQSHSIGGRKIRVYPSEKQAARRCCLYFGGISPTTTTEGMLFNFFSQFGCVVNVEISHKAHNGYPTPCGYVIFSSRAEASKVLLSAPHVLDGRVIHVVPLDQIKMAKKDSEQTVRESQTLDLDFDN